MSAKLYTNIKTIDLKWASVWRQKKNGICNFFFSFFPNPLQQKSDHFAASNSTDSFLEKNISEISLARPQVDSAYRNALVVITLKLWRLTGERHNVVIATADG